MSKAKAAVAILAACAVAVTAFWKFADPGRTAEPAGDYVPPANLSQWTAKDVRYDLERRGIEIPAHLDGIWVQDRFFSREEIYGSTVLNELGVARKTKQGDASPEEE